MARITLEIADDIAVRLRADAEAAGMSEATLIEKALSLYLEQVEAFRAFVAEGEADVAAGRVEDFDTVMNALEARILQGSAVAR